MLTGICVNCIIGAKSSFLKSPPVSQQESFNLPFSFHLGFKNQVIPDPPKKNTMEHQRLSTSSAGFPTMVLTDGAQIEDKELREIPLHEPCGPGQPRGHRAAWHSLILKHRIHELVQGTNFYHQHAGRNCVRN